MFLLRFVQVALSVVSLSFVAKYFGITLDRDTWLISLNCIMVVDLALWGPINQTFRAKFVLLKEEVGETHILDRTRSLLVVVGVVSLFVVTIMMFFPTAISRLLAPTYEDERLRMLSVMLTAIAPSLLVNQFCQIGTSILNAYESFFIPEISQLITTVFNILCVVFLAPKIGINALLISYYIGLSVLLLLLVIQLHRRRIPLFQRLTKIKLRDFYPFFLYALPFFVPFFFIQVNLVIEKSLANLLGDGMVSILDYSRKFVDMPMNVLTSVLLTMLVPVLSTRFARSDIAGFLQEFKQVYQLGLLVVTALISFFLSSSTELISAILFNEHQMDEETVGYISDLSRYYAWTTLANFFYIIFGLALLASGKGKIYATFGVIAQIIVILINLVWYKHFGSYTFPVSFMIAHGVAAVILFFYFPAVRHSLYPITAKYLIVLVLTIIISKTVNAWVNQYLENDFAALAVNTCVIGVTLLALVFSFRLDERLHVIRLVNIVLKPNG